MSHTANTVDTTKTFSDVIADRIGSLADPLGDDPIEDVADAAEQPVKAASGSAFVEPSPEELAEAEKMLAMFAASSAAKDVDAAIHPEVIARPSIKQQSKVPLWKTSTGESFRRVYKQPGYSWPNLPCVEVKEGKLAGLYLVHPAAVLPVSVKDKVKLYNFYTAITHAGEYGVWWISQGHEPTFNSAIEAVRECVRAWRGTVWRKDHFDLIVPSADIPDPDWSALPAGATVFVLATKERTISDDKHPVVRYLLGYNDADTKVQTDADGF